MPKYYKQIANSQTYWAGDIFVLREDGNLYWLGNENPEQNELESKKHWRKYHIAFNAQTLKNFNILDTWYEEIDVEDIRNRSQLLPYPGCIVWFVDRTSDRIEVRQIVWKWPSCIAGTVFYTKEKAERVARILNLLDCGFSITDFELQKNIGRMIISGQYYAEKSEKVENLLIEEMNRD